MRRAPAGALVQLLSGETLRLWQAETNNRSAEHGPALDICPTFESASGSQGKLQWELCLRYMTSAEQLRGLWFGLWAAQLWTHNALGVDIASDLVADSDIPIKGRHMAVQCIRYCMIYRYED